MVQDKCGRSPPGVQADAAAWPDWRDAAAYAPLLDADRSLSPARLSWYKAQGCFTEIIRYQTRLFVPACRAAEVLQRLTGPGEPSRSILQTTGQRR